MCVEGESQGIGGEGGEESEGERLGGAPLST